MTGTEREAPISPANPVPADSGRRVSWTRIHAYAQRFSEYAIVRAIAADAQHRQINLKGTKIDVPASRLSKKPGLANFGPLEPLTPFPGGFRLEELQVAGQRVRARLTCDAGEVWLALSPPGPDVPHGPFDGAWLRISYERTALPMSKFEEAGRVIAARMAPLLAVDPGMTWSKWLAEARPAKVRTTRLPDTETLEVRPDGKVYLRITDSCQERCVFCFFYDTDEVDNLLRHHDLAQVIERLPVEGVQQVILTGGEPTLNPRLPEYVAALYDKGFREIILQTNGIKLAEPGYLERLLPYKDRLGIGFSIHAANEASNDKVTTVARGYFGPKLDGFEKACRLGFRTKVTLVLNRLNLPELQQFVELVKARSAGGDTFVQFSLPSFEGRMNLFLDTYPRLEEIAQTAPAAFRRARELDLKVALCHQCQVPPCIVPDDVQHLESMWFADTPAMWSHDRAYGEACHTCALRPRCSGVWKGYADQFGLTALKPFRADEVDPIPSAPVES